MKKLLPNLLAASAIAFSATGVNATEQIDIIGTTWSLDTLYHAKIGPGTTQTHLELINPSGSKLQVFYLTVDKTTPGVSMRSVCATDKVAGNETVRKMATRKSGDNVLYFAGTNGDFYSTSGTATNGSSVVGSPTTSCTVDGEIFKSSNSNYQFVVDTEGVARIGRLNYYTGTATIGEKVTLFKGVNVGAPNNGITIYTPRYWGSANQEEYAGSCAEVTAKLVEGDSFSAGGKFRLEVTSDPTTTGDATIPSDGFVIFGRGTSKTGCNTGAVDFVSALKTGDIVEFDNIILWGPTKDEQTERIYPYTIVSGNPKNVGEGVTLDTEGERGDASSLHPRTGIGVSQSGDSIIMMVVDGRNGQNSIGVRTSQLADIMRWAKAYEAVNLDGGGSSTLYTSAFGVRNRCSDGTERSVGNAIFAVLEAENCNDTEIAEIRFKDWAMKFPVNGVYSPVIYGYNKYGVLVDTDVKDFTLSCPESLGEIINDGKTFFGNGSGYNALTATYNGITATLPVTIVTDVTGELKYNDILLDNYRDWSIDVQSLVNGDYMEISPMVFSWTSSDEAVATVSTEGVVNGLKNGNTTITGTLKDYVGTINLTVECPTDRIMAIKSASDSATYTVSKSSIKNLGIKTLENGLGIDYALSSARGPIIKLSSDSGIRIWSLPDQLQLRVNPIGDAALTRITVGIIANDNTPYQSKFENITSGEENILTVNLADNFDINDLGNYPIKLKYIYIEPKGKTSTDYRIEIPGIEAVYLNAPSGIEDVIANNVNNLNVTVANGVISIDNTAEIIEVYNVAGQKVAQAVNTSSMAAPVPGAYIVKAIINGEEFSSKVIY